MPYAPDRLSELTGTSLFSLWYYDTSDSRAATLAPGYLSSDAARLQPGHLMIVQAGDALAFLPVRMNAAVGNGLVLDNIAPPLRLNIAAAPRYAFTLSAVTPDTRSVGLDPLPVGLYTGRDFTVTGRASGPIASLQFRLLNSGGSTVAGPLTEPVSGGAASVTFTAPAPGTYRIRVQDAADATLVHTSASFVITDPLALLTESGATLVAQDGGQILL